MAFFHFDMPGMISPKDPYKHLLPTSDDSSILRPEINPTMLKTFHTRTFLPEAAMAAHVRPYSQKPVFSGNRSGDTPALAERRLR